jgi:tetratricopeptide (TPR) repeat protein
MAIDYVGEKIFDTAEIYFQKAEKIFKQSGCNDSVLLNTYKKWAELYYIKGDFAKTQDCCFKLLKATEASGSSYEQAIAYTMIAQLLNQTGQADKGIVYSRNATSFLSKIEIPSQKADVLFKLSKRYLWHYRIQRQHRVSTHRNYSACNN